MSGNGPITHERKFRIRHYECDAFGHLNNANYVRYMQETAFDASSAVGFDQAEYEKIGHYWLIRETDIEYIKPVGYGDRIVVKTWVMDFHRVRSRRVYEFYLSDSEDLIAKAVTDWVYLNNITGKPATIPDEMIKAFIPSGHSSHNTARQRFPVPPDPPKGVFNTQRRVAWNDLDPVQHVNNAVYLTYIEECGMQVLAAHGWPVKRMIDERIAIFVRRHQIQYRQPAVLDDELTLSTWASDVRRSTAIRHFVIQDKSKGSTLATVHSLGVWVDLDTGKPIRIPENFLSDFKTNIVN